MRDNFIPNDRNVVVLPPGLDCREPYAEAPWTRKARLERQNENASDAFGYMGLAGLAAAQQNLSNQFHANMLQNNQLGGRPPLGRFFVHWPF